MCNEKTNTIYTMKFSWNQTIQWLCLLSLGISLSAELISDYIGIDSWSILYFGIGLALIAIFIIILRYKKKEKWKSYQLGQKLLLFSFASQLHINLAIQLWIGYWTYWTFKNEKTNSTIVMENFNFDDNYDSIPKLNKNQMKNFKIIVLVLLILLVLGMLFG